MAKKIILEQMLLGPMENYIYFLGCATTKKIAVVDPAWDIPFLEKAAKQKDYQITALLLTHGHPDHIEGVEALLKKFDVPVYISRQEADFFMPDFPNLKLTADHEQIPIGQITVECLHTPGHTPGCQCYRVEDILLTGDVLFVEGVGRCDLPGGNAKVLYNSIYNRILKLPESTGIYPGHNYGDRSFGTLGELKKINPYLRCASEKYFVAGLTGFGL